MKIGYNYNGNLVIQEVIYAPNFEFIEITPEIEIQIIEMIKPILQGSVIIEGATQQEIEALKIQKVAEKTLEIYNIYEDLYTSSLARAVSKVGQGLTREHLNNLREEYNDVSILAQAYLNDGTILNAKSFQDITDEMNLDFPVPVLDQTVAYLNSVYASNPVYQIIPTDENTTQIQKFCWLIVNKYNLGEALWTYLKDLCSKFRKRMITNLDNLEFDKYDARMLLVKSITNETTVEEIQALEIQFNLYD